MTLPDPLHLEPDLLAALRRARRIVVFTGAGVSAESGIPTFRDALTGLWQHRDPMALATPEGFLADPPLVWGWYEWRRLKVRQALPNPGHRAIAELAALRPQLTLITQNVDDLHERAGSPRVLHLHGSLHAPRCFDCGSPFEPPTDAAATADPAAPNGWRAVALEHDGQRLPPPPCPACGGAVRPGVVWFGEALPADALEAAFAAAEQADLLISVGTSGVVEPAAAIPRVAQQAGAWVLHVNPEPMAPAGVRVRHLRGAAGQVLPQLMDALRS
jgi:NAD-dependent deacetylase